MYCTYILLPASLSTTEPRTFCCAVSGERNPQSRVSSTDSSISISHGPAKKDLKERLQKDLCSSINLFVLSFRISTLLLDSLITLQVSRSTLPHSFNMRFAHSFLLLAAYWILTSASGLPEKRAGTVVCDSSLKISGSLLTLTSGDTEEVLKAGFMDVTTRDSKNKQSKVLITKCDEGKRE